MCFKIKMRVTIKNPALSLYVNMLNYPKTVTGRRHESSYEFMRAESQSVARSKTKVRVTIKNLPLSVNTSIVFS